MSISYEQTGRRHQKERTRQALIGAARNLLADGATPTVEAAAAAAAISRATAYRYFPNQHALLAAAHPEVDVTTLLGADAPPDPEARLDTVVNGLANIFLSSETTYRTMLRLSLEPDPAARGDLALRKGLRLGWIEHALDPIRDQLPTDEFRRLVHAIAVGDRDRSDRRARRPRRPLTHRSTRRDPLVRPCPPAFSTGRPSRIGTWDDHTALASSVADPPPGIVATPPPVDPARAVLPRNLADQRKGSATTSTLARFSRVPVRVRPRAVRCSFPSVDQTGDTQRRSGEKADRRASRELIAAYHQTQLRALLEHVRAGFAQLDAGDIDEFDLDDLIHHYKRSAAELWKFCGSSGGQWQQAANTLTYLREHGEEPDWWEMGAPRRTKSS